MAPLFIGDLIRATVAVNIRLPQGELLSPLLFTVKILKFGTPQIIAIIVLKIEKFDVTLHSCRLLINSIFGVLYSYFWTVGTPDFPRMSSNLHCGPPTFSKTCLWDSYF